MPIPALDLNRRTFRQDSPQAWNEEKGTEVANKMYKPDSFGPGSEVNSSDSSVCISINFLVKLITKGFKRITAQTERKRDLSLQTVSREDTGCVMLWLGVNGNSFVSAPGSKHLGGNSAAWEASSQVQP